MEPFFCGIYDPPTSKQYIPAVLVKLLMRPRVAYVAEAVDTVFARVKDVHRFQRVGKWELDRIQLWKLDEPMSVSDWENNRSPLSGPIESRATRLLSADELSMLSKNEAGQALLDFVVVLELEEMLDQIRDLIPRNFQETLSEILRGPTPSQQAKSTEYKDHQGKPRPVFDGRYDFDKPQNTEGPPIALYHPVFAQFRTQFANVDLPVPQKVLRSTVKVVDVSSAIYSDARKGEKRRRENLVPSLMVPFYIDPRT
ncbi:hypothetical protein DFS33DRAFT_638384 [Desarmillaria ectypa]|nr:hypothetical protein DFS33DRAFT_638384 [Desarmillaria ectypa]